MSRARRLLSAVVVFLAASVPAEATFAPAPIRLARLFERAEWAPAPISVRAVSVWHVVERLER